MLCEPAFVITTLGGSPNGQVATEKRKATMRYILFIPLMLMIGGCDQIGSSGGRYSLFETSKGVIYRLDTKSGETETIYSPTGWPKLTKEALFEGENKKTYQYLGNGKLKELSAREAADILVEKYAK